MDNSTHHALTVYRHLEQALADGIELPEAVADAVVELAVAWSAALGVDDVFTTDGQAFEAWFARTWQRHHLFAAEPSDRSLAVRGAWHLMHLAQWGKAHG